MSAEVKNGATGNIVCKVQGEWNGVMEFSYANVRYSLILTFVKLNIVMYYTPPKFTSCLPVAFQL